LFIEQCVRHLQLAYRRRAGFLAVVTALSQHPLLKEHTLFDRLSAYAPQALAVLRIVTALLFIAHGTQKLFNFPVAGFGPPEGLMLAAAIIELVTGILVLIGFFTRPAAFLASGTMAVAFFLGHVAPSGVFWPTGNGGDAAVLFCFVFLYLVFAGPGAWSVNKR
jgi:putative oxidoreductase